MLPRAHRLRRSTDFSRVVRDGRRTSSHTVVLHTLYVDDLLPTRVGFVVSKGVGNAVVRNRVKRRLRHLTMPLTATPGRAIVVRATPEAAGANYSRLSADLDRCLQKARA